MNKILWYLKQLFPLRYKSEYMENGEKCLCIWRMWFGRCYNIKAWSVHPVTRNISELRRRTGVYHIERHNQG